MDLVVSYTMYWCPYSEFEVLDIYSLVFHSLGRIEVVIPTIVLALLVLAPSFHCLHPSITFQFNFQPDWLLDLWHGGTFSLLETFVGQASLFILCLGSALVTKLAFGKLDSMPKSFWSVVLMFGIVQNSPWSLEMLLAKTESSCTTYIGNVYMRPWKMKMLNCVS